MARKTLIALALLAAVGASAVTGQGSGPRMGNIGAIMKLQTNLQVLKFGEADSCTVNFLAVMNDVPAHYHAKHEETVVVVEGEGVFTLASEKRTIKSGDVFFIPRGTVHSFAPTSEFVLVVSTFAPKFDGKDRIFVGG